MEMRKQPRNCDADPEQDARHPARGRKPCDNMPQVVGVLPHLRSFLCAGAERTRMGLRITAIIIGLLLTLTPAARAQAPSRVAGRVLDQTGSVLHGATIDLVVNATEMTATTDAQGQYRFDAVPSGSAELTYR